MSENYIKLDLETLKYVKFMFDIFSDGSSRCHGYLSLCDLIKKEEEKLNPPLVFVPNQEPVCEHGYSKSMNQPYPRKCVYCNEPEPNKNE